MNLLTSIEFQCPECGHAHHVPESYRGRKGRCSRCATVLRVQEGLAARYVPSASSAERAAYRRRSGVVVGIAKVAGGARPSPALIPAWVLAGILGLGGATYAVTGLLRTPDDALACVPRAMSVVGALDYQRAVAELELGGAVAERDAPLEQLGVDPARDLDRIYVAANPRTATPTGDGVVVLIEGRFDLTRLLDGAASQGGIEWETHSHRGVFYRVGQVRPGQELGVALLRTDLLAVAAPATLQAVIDTATGAAPSVYADRDLRGLIASHRERLLWLAARLDADARSKLPQGGSVESVALSLDAAGSQLTLSGAARFGDRDEAQQAQQQLQRLIDGLQQQGAGLPVDLDGVLVSQGVALSGGEVSLDLTFDGDKVRELAQQASQR